MGVTVVQPVHEQSPDGNKVGLAAVTAAEWRWLVAGVGVVALALGGTMLLRGSPWVRVLDNLHWTLSYACATAVAVLAARRARGTMRRARGWFATGLGALLGGQLLWDVQVATGWNPFPGPSDALFVAMGPLLGVGVLALTRGESRIRRVAVVLDAVGFGVAVLALTLALYIPRRGTFDGFTLAVLAAYPTALLTVTVMLAVVLLEQRERLRGEYLLLLAGVFGQGLLWMKWNAMTLENTLGDGIPINFLFSLGALLLGLGIASFEPRREEVAGRRARLYEIVSRLLPLGLVVAASVASVAGAALPPSVRFSVAVCMGVVILVAVVRQSLLLGESDRLLAAEEQNRLLQQRFADSRRLESLGTLAGGIAHDFNNVLTAILGHAELLALRPDLDDPAHHSVAGVRAAALRARDMVRRILAFSRQDAGTAEVVDVVALVREVHALLRAALPARHQLVVEAHGSPRVRVVPAQLHQVLMNLGTNASQAIGERAGNIRFTVDTVDGPAASDVSAPVTWAEIRVADDGVGMTDEIRARMFEPFFTTRERGEGTGLGLSIVHRAVSELGGTIDVTSAPGAGTTLRIRLRPCDGEVVEARVSTPAEASSEAAQPDRLVLVVDDERTIANLLVLLLARSRRNAVAVTSGEEALALVRENPSRYDLVITDMSMPAMSGAELATALREIRPDLPMVLSSGTDFVLAGTAFDDVLPKPYTAAAIETLLASVARRAARPVA